MRVPGRQRRGRYLCVLLRTARDFVRFRHRHGSELVCGVREGSLQLLCAARGRAGLLARSRAIGALPQSRWSPSWISLMHLCAAVQCVRPRPSRRAGRDERCSGGRRHCVGLAVPRASHVELWSDRICCHWRYLLHDLLSRKYGVGAVHWAHPLAATQSSPRGSATSCSWLVTGASLAIVCARGFREPGRVATSGSRGRW